MNKRELLNRIASGEKQIIEHIEQVDHLANFKGQNAMNGNPNHMLQPPIQQPTMNYQSSYTNEHVQALKDKLGYSGDPMDKQELFAQTFGSNMQPRQMMTEQVSYSSNPTLNEEEVRQMMTESAMINLIKMMIKGNMAEFKPIFKEIMSEIVLDDRDSLRGLVKEVIMDIKKKQDQKRK